MAKRSVLFVGVMVVLLCLYAAIMPFSVAVYWAGLAVFTGALVGTAGAVICRLAPATTVLGSILGSLGITFVAYHVFDYREFGQIHEVIAFGILGGVLGVVLCAAFVPRKLVGDREKGTSLIMGR